MSRSLGVPLATYLKLQYIISFPAIKGNSVLMRRLIEGSAMNGGTARRVQPMHCSLAIRRCYAPRMATHVSSKRASSSPPKHGQRILGESFSLVPYGVNILVCRHIPPCVDQQFNHTRHTVRSVPV
ncbi:hypothetical protein BHE74_00013576 [Ensete ventricosum]|nr:hypothetical protein BHE74_00013576 [Ensete ventricosum]